jgi:general secretion pathway protein I
MKTPHAGMLLNGFTLLEVLIAMALLAIVMVSAIKITADNINNLRYLENKSLAAAIAGNHAVELRLAKEKPEAQDGWEEMAGRRWYWQVKRRTSSIAGLWHYRIEVYLEGDKAPYFSLTSETAKS